MQTPKKIIVCIDGTNNAPTSGRTNVSRFFRALDKTAADQIAYYQPGVGTLDPENPSGWLKKKIRRGYDLATAGFLRRHVTSAYHYLMQVYNPGDAIYLLGFSRGAYTSRVLAGMLHKVGLLYRGQEEMIPFAWSIYRPVHNDQTSGRFKRFYAHTVDVDFIGVWDTVSSVGTRFSPKKFPSTYTNPDVKCVRHAVALDEHREAYNSNLWNGNPPDCQDVKQVWFAGVHADIGGGYTGDVSPGLGAIPLMWMIREAETNGLRFLHKEMERIFWREGGHVPKKFTVEAVTDRFVGQLAHDELKGWKVMNILWKLCEYIPLPTRCKDAEGNFHTFLRRHKGMPRVVPDHALIHQSVLLRQQIIPEYRPVNLPDPLAPARICW